MFPPGLVGKSKINATLKYGALMIKLPALAPRRRAATNPDRSSSRSTLVGTLSLETYSSKGFNKYSAKDDYVTTIAIWIGILEDVLTSITGVIHQQDLL